MVRTKRGLSCCVGQKLDEKTLLVLQQPSQPVPREHRDAVSRGNVAARGTKCEPVQIVATSVLWKHSEASGDNPYPYAPAWRIHCGPWCLVDDSADQQLTRSR